MHATAINARALQRKLTPLPIQHKLSYNSLVTGLPIPDVDLFANSGRIVGMSNKRSKEPYGNA